ncbi:MAG: S8 family serine peptidase [Methylomonas sp.]|nr:S8 family serine peptidase [Methylomonas sp.]
MLTLTPPHTHLNQSTNLNQNRQRYCRQALSLKTSLVAATWLASSVAFAAQVEPNEYAQLLKEANSSGTVRVMITLDDSLTLDAIGNKQAAIRAEMDRLAKPLIAELGPEALETGYWNNGMGQIGLYITSKGLNILAATANAKSFMPDITSQTRFRAYDGDGSLDAIEATINEHGFAEVEVFLNTDSADYDLAEDGRTTFRPSPELKKQATARLNNITAKGFAAGFKNIDSSPVQALSPRPSFRVTIDKNAFYGLRESNDVRAIKPVDFVDPRPSQWSSEALAAAEANGVADVIITLRGGTNFSPKTGYMSTAAIKSQADAHKRAMTDILTRAGASLASAKAQNYADIGSAHIQLSYDALAQLYQNADPRILSVDLNKPSAELLLTNSTSLLNMQPTWNLGYRGTGQTIMVIDNGIRKDHELFKMNGATKVIYEACFGSTGNDNLGVFWQSLCPAKDSNGDSPLNYPGSGAPLSNDALACAAMGNKCSHGTHVAGIAAGRSSPNVSPSNLQGIAPDASLVSAQVFSYSSSANKMSAFGADILAALNALYSATAPGTNNPYVANMSLGGEKFVNDCNNTVVGGVTSNLISRGVPIIVATGNDGYKDGINWPACVPNTIKVSSVVNNAIGTSLSGFANIGKPANFTGPILLAPGDGINSASRTSTTATLQLQGTSQAAPHVAGFYAAIKAAVPGISVADATAWIVTSASFAVTYNLGSPTGTQTYRRLRMPF